MQKRNTYPCQMKIKIVLIETPADDSPWLGVRKGGHLRQIITRSSKAEVSNDRHSVLINQSLAIQ